MIAYHAAAGCVGGRKATEVELVVLSCPIIRHTALLVQVNMSYTSSR